MPRIFISYRRTDSVTITGRIYDHLVRAFGDDNVFKDVDDIPLGADFRQRLHEEVSGCNVLLAIIGQTWVSTLAPEGTRRLENPDDFVRIEIAAGLSRERVLVVPVLVNGAPMPGSIDLPSDLQELAYRNAAIIRDDPDFRRDMDRLIAKITEFAAQAAPGDQVSPSEQAALQAEAQTTPAVTPPIEAAPVQAAPLATHEPSPAIPREQVSYQTRRLDPTPEEPPAPSAPRGFLPGPVMTVLAGLLVVGVIAVVALILATQGGGGNLGGAITGSDPSTDRLVCGGVYHGELSDEVPSQTWQMPAEGQGEWVLLSMNAYPEGDLDPVLILRDPAGSVVREDDDTGLGHNARLDQQIWTPGTWEVVAGRFEDSGMGSYQLRMTCDSPPIDCDSEQYGTLSADNPNDWWLVYAGGDHRVTVHMQHTGTNQDGSYMDPAVAIYDQNDDLLVANDDVTDGNADAEAWFDVGDDGLYLIEATRSSTASGWGEYVLAVTCGSPDDPSQQSQSQQ